MIISPQISTGLHQPCGDSRSQRHSQGIMLLLHAGKAHHRPLPRASSPLSIIFTLVAAPLQYRSLFKSVITGCLRESFKPKIGASDARRPPWWFQAMRDAFGSRYVTGIGMVRRSPPYYAGARPAPSRVPQWLSRVSTRPYPSVEKIIILSTRIDSARTSTHIL